MKNTQKELPRIDLNQLETVTGGNASDTTPPNDIVTLNRGKAWTGPGPLTPKFPDHSNSSALYGILF